MEIAGWFSLLVALDYFVTRGCTLVTKIITLASVCCYQCAWGEIFQAVSKNYSELAQLGRVARVAPTVVALA